MLKVYLVRHAESVGNKKGIKMGSDIDLGLSEAGEEQARKLIGFFKDKNIKSIYSSDLKRTFGTAKILGEGMGVKVETTPDLRELKIGDWADGQSDPLKRWIDFYEEQRSLGIPRENIRPPGGENSWDHMSRVKNFLSSIQNLDGNIVVVAHSGTNKVFIGTLKGTDPDNFYTFKQDNACVNEIEYDGKEWKIININNTNHLK